MRTQTKVDIKKLQNIINKIEQSGPKPTQQILFNEVANAYNLEVKPDKPISASIVYLRVKEHGLTIATPKAKKGRVAGAVGGVRKSRAEKISNNPEAEKAIRILRKETPANLHTLVDKVQSGSLRAAIKLNCLNCADYQIKEIKHCQVTSCPMWVLRPYQ